MGGEERERGKLLPISSLKNVLFIFAVKIRKTEFKACASGTSSKNEKYRNYRETDKIMKIMNIR